MKLGHVCQLDVKSSIVVIRLESALFCKRNELLPLLLVSIQVFSISCVGNRECLLKNGTNHLNGVLAALTIQSSDVKGALQFVTDKARKSTKLGNLAIHETSLERGRGSQLLQVSSCDRTNLPCVLV